MMTRKDYILIAQVLNQHLVRGSIGEVLTISEGNDTVDGIMEELCIEFSKTNPAFNRNKFKRAVYAGSNMNSL